MNTNMNSKKSKLMSKLSNSSQGLNFHSAKLVDLLNLFIKIILLPDKAIYAWGWNEVQQLF